MIFSFFSSITNEKKKQYTKAINNNKPKLNCRLKFHLTKKQQQQKKHIIVNFFLLLFIRSNYNQIT